MAKRRIGGTVKVEKAERRKGGKGGTAERRNGRTVNGGTVKGGKVKGEKVHQLPSFP
jgi:hypothetical protein